MLDFLPAEDYHRRGVAGAQYDLNAYNARCAQIAEDEPLFFFCAPVMPMAAEMAERAGLDALPEGLRKCSGFHQVYRRGGNQKKL